MTTQDLTTAVTGAAPKKPETIFDVMKLHHNEIARALPRHMTADRMARIVTTEIRKMPKLMKCNVKSLFGAVIQASQLGLEPGGGLGHCYLIPFKDECQLIIGYRGMIDLARRSGQMLSLTGEPVYAKDTFSYQLGLDPKLHHVPSTEDDRGALTYAYAVAQLKGGGTQFKVMSKAEIEKHRKRSPAVKAGMSTPWDTDYDMMAVKTVIRRLFKYLPVSIELQRATALDEAAELGEQNNAAVLDGEFSVFDDEAPTDPAQSLESVRAALEKSNTPELLDLARSLINGAPKEHQPELHALAATMAAQIKNKQATDDRR